MTAGAARANGERRIAVNGIAHWCRVAGAEHRTAPLLVVHGGPGGNCYNFERTIGPRLEAFATTIYYEQRGCGRSDPPSDPDAYSIPLLVADLEALRRALGLARIVPLGFSFGGELALEYALAHPRSVERLIVQAPSIGDSRRAAAIRLAGLGQVARGEVARQIRPLLNGDGAPEDRLARVWELVDREMVDRLLFANPGVARLNRRLWEESGLTNTGDMSRALDRQPPHAPPLLERPVGIRAPTLVIVGRHDRNTGVAMSRAVAARIPDATLVICEERAHFPDMEESEKYAATVRAFWG